MKPFLWSVIIALLMALFVVAKYPLQQPHQAPGVETPQNVTASVHGQQDSHDAPAGNIEAASRQQQHGGHSETPEFYGVKPGEFLLFLATVGLWYATARLVKEAREGTNRQLEALRESNDRQSRDMQASIVAAQRSADAAVQAVAANRAWLVYDEIQIAEVSNATVGTEHIREGLALSIQWRNRGRSPAFKSQAHIMHQVIPYSQQTAPVFSPELRSEESYPLGPDATISSVLRFVGETERRDVFSRASALCVYCAVQYQDAFQTDPPRMSEICFRVAFNGERRDKESPGAPSKILWEIRVFGPQNNVT